MQRHTDGLVGAVWPAARMFATSISSVLRDAGVSSDNGLERTAMLELGCGCAASALAGIQCGAAVCIATDLPECMQLARDNCAEYARSFCWSYLSDLPEHVTGWQSPDMRQILLCMPLDWTQIGTWWAVFRQTQQCLLFPNELHWVAVGAECVYSDTPSASLAQVCAFICTHLHARVLLAHRRRLPAAESSTWEALSSGDLQLWHAPAAHYCDIADVGTWFVLIDVVS